MKSQEDGIQHATTAAVSSTPTHGVRKIVVRLKTPTKDTNTMISNGETFYAHKKEIGRSCKFSNAEKMNGKRVLDMDSNTEFQENTKKAKKQKQTYASISNATNMLILNGESSYAHDKEMERSCSFSNAEKMKCKRVLDMDCNTKCQENTKKAKKQTYFASTSKTRYDEIKKSTDTFEKRKVLVEKSKKLIMSFVNSEKPACPICRKKCVSKLFLYQHMVRHTDKDWDTFIRSGEHQNHDAKVVDLSKGLFGWDVKTGKRGRLGSSSVEYVNVNKVPNAKYYFRLGRFDLREVDEDVKEAAKILVLMANDQQWKGKTSTMVQSEMQVVNGIMCLDDPVTPPAMVESGAQVEESVDTISGAINGVRGFDLNKLPAFEDVCLTE